MNSLLGARFTSPLLCGRRSITGGDSWRRTTELRCAAAAAMSTDMRPRRDADAGSLQGSEYPATRQRSCATPRPPWPAQRPHAATHAAPVPSVKASQAVHAGPDTAAASEPRPPTAAARAAEHAAGKATPDPAAAKRVAWWADLWHKLSPSAVKALVKQYGAVGVSLHTSIFLTTFGGFYAALTHGVDVNALIHVLPIPAGTLDPSTGKLAVAYGATLATGPGRGLLTITLTPGVARRWWAFTGKGLPSSPRSVAKNRAVLSPTAVVEGKDVVAPVPSGSSEQGTGGKDVSRKDRRGI